MKDLYRTNFVMGVGPVPCSVLLIGEAPGKDEDFWGKPFVGRAGTVLTRLLKKSAGLKREDVYITNAVKQRPPDNRKPFIQEIRAHRAHLIKEIETVKPKVIVTLGKTAIESLLNIEMSESLADIRKQYHNLFFMGIPVIITYHPASLLYGADPKSLQNDIIKLKLYTGAKNGKEEIHTPEKRNKVLSPKQHKSSWRGKSGK